MKSKKKKTFTQWRSLPVDDGHFDEEEMLDMSPDTPPTSDDDLDFDLGLQKIATKFPIANEGKLNHSSNSDNSTNLSVATPTSSVSSSTTGPKASNLRQRAKGIFTRFPVRDPSWLTAVSFTLGSGVFVINAFFLLLPMIEPRWNFIGEGEYGGPATSVLGTLIFLVGAWTAVLEALNVKRSDIEGIGNDEGKDEESHVDEEGGRSMGYLPYDSDGEALTSTRFNGYHSMTATPATIGSRAFIWWPSNDELRGYYLQDQRFLASIIQMIGALIFCIATVTDIPGMLDLSNTMILAALSLLPTLLGGLLFLSSSLIYTASIQDVWYLPTPWRLSWHVGFWNAVGSLGFALAGGLPLFGLFGEGAVFQAALADFWGSWSFMIGSAVHWYVVMANYS